MSHPHRRSTASMLAAGCIAFALAVTTVAAAGEPHPALPVCEDDHAEPVLGHDDSPRSGHAHEHAASADAGMRIYVDPQTGELRSEPVGIQPRRRAADEAAVSTSQTGLFEQSSPGGGVMVDLQGRFQNEMRATIGPNGELRTDCVDLPLDGTTTR